MSLDDPDFVTFDHLHSDPDDQIRVQPGMDWCGDSLVSTLTDGPIGVRQATSRVGSAELR